MAGAWLPLLTFTPLQRCLQPKVLLQENPPLASRRQAPASLCWEPKVTGEQVLQRYEWRIHPDVVLVDNLGELHHRDNCIRSGDLPSASGSCLPVNPKVPARSDSWQLHVLLHALGLEVGQGQLDQREHEYFGRDFGGIEEEEAPEPRPLLELDHRRYQAGPSSCCFTHPGRNSIIWAIMVGRVICCTA